VCLKFLCLLWYYDIYLYDGGNGIMNYMLLIYCTCTEKASHGYFIQPKVQPDHDFNRKPKLYILYKAKTLHFIESQNLTFY
jgi:hypothetical protein